jgi:phage tail sheath protein FI
MPETFLHGVEVLEVDTGARPIRSVRSSVIGLVGTAIGDGVGATVTIGTSNASLAFTGSQELGAEGNAIQVRAINPGTNNAALAVTKSGNVITISLATDGSAAATSTAAQVRTAFNSASTSGTWGVTCSLPGTTTGASVYVAHDATNLAGGTNPSFPLDRPVLLTSARDVDTKLGANSYLAKALEAIFQQAGAVVVVVRTQDLEGDATELTGPYALKRAQADIGYTPRIIVGEDGSADPIAALKSVADSLRAIAVVGIIAPEATDATTWVTSNGNDRTYAVWPPINGGQDPAPFVAGLIAKSDNDRGFWWSPSNQEIFGILSLDYPVDFMLGDATSLANVLNEGNVTTFIRQGGFRLWGNRTGSIDSKWAFLSVRRTADIINDSIQRAHLWAVDRNITKTYLQDVAESVNGYLKSLENQGAILGGRCWPDPDLNSPANIAQGKVFFNFEFTPPYPAEHITFRSILTNDYLSELV